MTWNWKIPKEDMLLQCDGFEPLPLPPAIRTAAVEVIDSEADHRIDCSQDPSIEYDI